MNTLKVAFIVSGLTMLLVLSGNSSTVFGFTGSFTHGPNNPRIIQFAPNLSF